MPDEGRDVGIDMPCYFATIVTCAARHVTYDLNLACRVSAILFSYRKTTVGAGLCARL
jgi:hypothetical protein